MKTRFSSLFVPQFGGGMEIIMLNEWTRPERPGDTQITEGIKEAEKRLAQLQTTVKEKKIPIIVVLEGWDAAGKGSVLGT